MLESLKRRATALWSDETLRRWICARLVGRVRPGQAYSARRTPPYVSLPEKFCVAPGTALDADLFPQERPVRTRREAGPIYLHGRDISRFVRQPSSAIFAQADDLEFALAIHRFAWVPINRKRLGDEDVARTWAWWIANFADARDGWHWHPYTASERALNLLDYLEMSGIPNLEMSLPAALARHAACIATGLEYFGESATGNHLSNNARALYRLGLALDEPSMIDIGRKILSHEGRRIFDSQGVLREGSSHYQLLATKWFLDCWRWARRLGRSEAGDFAEIASRAVMGSRIVARRTGTPLIGDVSPDSPPTDLTFICGMDRRHEEDWFARLPPQDADVLHALIGEMSVAGPDHSSWIAADWGRWSFATFVAETGWNPIPGHGHQDLGGFALSFGQESVVADPGRGHYGESEESRFYASAEAHSVLEIDGYAAYPLNRPAYDDEFRRQVISVPPTLVREADSITLFHDGFSRLHGVGTASRCWRYHRAADEVNIEDRVDGSRSANILRRLVTPLPVERKGDKVILTGALAKYRLEGQGDLRLRPITVWHAYGEGRPGTMLEWRLHAQLPFEGNLTIAKD